MAQKTSGKTRRSQRGNRETASRSNGDAASGPATQGSLPRDGFAAGAAGVRVERHDDGQHGPDYVPSGDEEERAMSDGSRTVGGVFGTSGGGRRHHEHHELAEVTRSGARERAVTPVWCLRTKAAPAVAGHCRSRKPS